MFRLKANQPQTLAAVKEWFEAQPVQSLPETSTYQVSQKGHGRLVTYTIQTTTALNDYLQDSLAWPRVGQVLAIQRRCIYQNTGQVCHSQHYALTDLSPQQADPLTLFRLWQQHWHIENKVHWVRDVDFAEDRSRSRTGNLPLNLSLLRNAVLNLLRTSGYANITQARTYFSANVPAACSLVGIPLE